MSTLTNGTVTITPTEIDGFESVREHGNIVHRILGSEDVDVVLRPATLRNGTMSLVIGLDEAASAAAEDALATATVWTLSTAGERDSIDMHFVVRGSVTRTLDPETRDVWLVGFGWQEVPG